MLPARADSAVAPYWELTVALDADAPETTEAVTNRLWELGAVGVVEEGAALRAFYPPGTDTAGLAAMLHDYLHDLAALELPGVVTGVTVAALSDERWADAWRAHFRPVAVGRRLLLSPPWEVTDPERAGGRQVLLIEPGRAFGTGSHESTCGCLELLERALECGVAPRALDVGCGSGILAIAAARLGVPRVDAIDMDPDAVAATEENAQRNAAADRVHASVADVARWAGPPAPLVLANLLGAAHLTLAPTLTELTTPGGTLIAGGLLVAEVPAVAGAFAAAGCWLVEVAEHEGWATLLLRRGE